MLGFLDFSFYVFGFRPEFLDAFPDPLPNGRVASPDCGVCSGVQWCLKALH